MKQQPHDTWARYFDFVYERTYGNIYQNFTDKTINAVNNILADNGTIIDFGAGTGRLTIPLKQQNYNISAIEKSQGMAEIITRKAHDLKLKIDVYNVDITEYRGAKADLGIALFTVLNYATTEEQIKAMISNIKLHLNPAGYFFFDLPKRILFPLGTQAINQPDFKREITLTEISTDIYQYSDICSGVFNGENFSYKDTFNIRYWDDRFIDYLLSEHGFENIKRDFSEFMNTGSDYKLYQLMN